MNESEKAALQRHIDNKVEPFLAMHHYYKAKKELDSRHQLINLALALELGIKEYLVRKKRDPEVEAIIKYVPSPPLFRLYGEILESFSGEKTPVNMKLIRGITDDRNELVHRVIKSENVNLTHDIKDYFCATKIALFHLWIDLYPYDEAISFRYKKLLDVNSGLIRKGYSFSPKK